MTRATTHASNACTRGDPGLGADDSGPFSLLTVTEILRRSSRTGQLRRPGRPAQISAVSGARRHRVERALMSLKPALARLQQAA